jgi:signal transduction histidine kinase
MNGLPAAIVDYLRSVEVEKRLPAFLHVDRNTALLEKGGPLGEYGLDALNIGDPVCDKAFFLTGLIPLDGVESILLECVKTDGARPADLHVFQRPDGYWLLFLDATESEARQREVQQKGNELNLSYRKLLKEVQKKEVLLHCIVHDLSGPLMGIRGGFELLERESLSDEGQVLVEIGLRQARRQAHLISEILDAFAAEVASLESFETEPERAPSIVKAARSAIELLKPAFDLAQVQIEFKPETGQDSDLRVVGEESRLDRIFANLIENALRFSTAGTSVTVGLKDEGSSVLATIDDHGPGVGRDVAPNLFQKLSQGEHGKGKIGLGLYFCRITVEQWGGEIGHEPRTEGGTRFWFRLPKPKDI